MEYFSERIKTHTTEILAQCLVRLFPQLSQDEVALQDPPNTQLGEFAFPCFALAKLARKSPQLIASELAQNLTLDQDPYLKGATATGPYVNIQVNRERFIAETLREIHALGNAFGTSKIGNGKTVVVDYSSPNIAKHLAFHHLRSTVIGNSLYRIMKTLGYRTIGINHLGDWGTQFGKLITAFLRWGPQDGELGEDPIATLNDLYLRFQTESKSDPQLIEEAREWFKRLEDGDSQARQLWARFRQVSLDTFEKVYRRLGITFDEVSGESTYIARIPAVLSLLEKKGLSSRSEGALVVDLSAYQMPPCLLRKTDEATLYATRDLCAAISRAEKYAFERLLYVVDSGQTLHFKQFFKVLELMGYAWASQIEHINFGIIKFAGSKTRTRQGNIILLEDVLDQAVELIRDKITEKNPDLLDKDKVAEEVGIGAIIFADLSGRRVRDVNFDWQEILNFDGRTGPYVQYSHARACSILRKGSIAAPDLLGQAQTELLRGEEEWQIVRALAQYPIALKRAALDCEPSLVADSLLSICEAFHRYHASGKNAVEKRVLSEDAALRKVRLLLTDSTRQVLANGLAVFGMHAPQSM